ncbi:hypothetical protein C8Q79DRAFT_158351 [Trametes meyenii]|nr:hypothetical protein C8Q79DRAFT_158351 [Trametes meyenii]
MPARSGGSQLFAFAKAHLEGGGPRVARLARRCHCVVSAFRKQISAKGTALAYRSQTQLQGGRSERQILTPMAFRPHSVFVQLNQRITSLPSRLSIGFLVVEVFGRNDVHIRRTRIRATQASPRHTGVRSTAFTTRASTQHTRCKPQPKLAGPVGGNLPSRYPSTSRFPDAVARTAVTSARRAPSAGKVFNLSSPQLRHA